MCEHEWTTPLSWWRERPSYIRLYGTHCAKCPAWLILGETWGECIQGA